MDIRIQEAAFDPGQELNRFAAGNAGAGAAVSFTGFVRSAPNHPIVSLTLECYPELALKQIETIGQQAIARFGLIALCATHRFGSLVPGEPIVQVMAMAAHRKAAFEGAEFVMDYLKTDAPFWKKEHLGTGARWVDKNDADDSAKARWQ
jgi:molybdopterin synthase catalytic subunit